MKDDQQRDSEAKHISFEIRDSANLIIGGRYIPRELIGEGGWCAVYSAYDKVLDRYVAVKLLHRPLAANPDNLIRFEREAKAASSLSHDNIASIFDYGLLPSGQPFMVMELLSGMCLSDVIEKNLVHSHEDALNIVQQVATALSYAHSKGLVHRDIKPSNIFLIADGAGKTLENVRVKLLDFGLAKWLDEEKLSTLTNSGTVLGTPSYMSPEQCRREKVDARTDIYSLGCTTYELLSGKKPFAGSTLDCMHAHLLEEPMPLRSHEKSAKVSFSLDQFVRRAMAKNPDKRPASAQDFSSQLAKARIGSDTFVQTLWGTFVHDLEQKRKVLVWIFAVGCFITLAYYAAPALLSWVGIRSIEVDASEVDPHVLDEVVKEMETKKSSPSP
ncbi:MAG: serine/threonine protein kinase [Candidatus Melainabacteria bacterium]|nr:serine/threonine protein kinase [Candidatus Melainabacteria bacterium]